MKHAQMRAVLMTRGCPAAGSPAPQGAPGGLQHRPGGVPAAAAQLPVPSAFQLGLWGQGRRAAAALVPGVP